MTLCRISFTILFIVLLVQSRTTRAQRSPEKDPLNPAHSSHASTHDQSTHIPNRQPPAPPQLAALLHSLSTYVSDTLFSLFTTQVPHATNNTTLEPMQKTTAAAMPPPTPWTAPFAWLRSQLRRLNNYLFPHSQRQSVLSHTTHLAAAAVEDVLVTLAEAHNALLLASIRHRPWFIRIPMYLYRRYSPSHSFRANHLFRPQNILLSDDVLLRQALVQFQSRFKEIGEAHPLASTIVDALESTRTKSTDDSQSTSPENTFFKFKVASPHFAIPSYIRDRLPSGLHGPVASISSGLHRVYNSFQWICHSAWNECWRMHLETIYNRSAPTVLECTTLYVRTVAVSVAKQLLFIVDSVARVVAAFTNAVAVMLDNLCSTLAPESLSEPFSTHAASYSFAYQFISLCRMALLLFVQAVRLLWNLTIYKRSFMFILACAFLHRHFWYILRFSFQFLRNCNSTDADGPYTRGVRRFWRSQKQNHIAPARPAPGKKPGRRGAGAKHHTDAAVEGNANPDEGGCAELCDTTDGDTEVPDNADVESITSADTAPRDRTPASRPNRNTGWSSARASLSEPARHNTQNFRSGGNAGSARRDVSKENDDSSEEPVVTSDDSSVVFVGSGDNVEKENDGKIAQSGARPQARVAVDSRTAGRARAPLRSHTNGGGNKANRSGFDFAMRLLDINSQTAQHAREAMQIACADAANRDEEVDTNEQGGVRGGKQASAKKVVVQSNPDRMTQYAQSMTRPRRTRRRVNRLTEDE